MPYVIPPAGVSAASFFDPTYIDPARPVAQLADQIDPITNDVGDLFATPNPVHAAVQFAFALERDSGAATGPRGNAFSKIRKIGDGTEREIRDEIERTLRPFVEAGAATYDRAKVEVEVPVDGDDVAGAFVVTVTETVTGTEDTFGPVDP